MTTPRRAAGKSARTTKVPATPTPPLQAAELDAALAIVEARAPGLRKAGIERLTVGAIDLYLAPPEAAAPPKGKNDDEDDDDAGVGDLLNLDLYRRGQVPRKTGGRS